MNTLALIAFIVLLYSSFIFYLLAYLLSHIFIFYLFSIGKKWLKFIIKVKLSELEFDLKVCSFAAPLRTIDVLSFLLPEFHIYF